MGERGARAPFYAPPRRKTSAEIISEARAAISAEMRAVEPGALRPLRTRRPYTPRPPSALDLKCLSVSGGSENAVAFREAGASFPSDQAINEILQADSLVGTRRKPATRAPERAGGEGWAALPRLPHLSGRSKPLHRRNTTGLLAEQVTNLETSSRRKHFAGGKSQSCEGAADAGASDGTGAGALAGAVTRLALQLPAAATAATAADNYEDMSLLELGDALCARGCEVERTLTLLRETAARAAGSAAGGALQEHVLRALYAHIDSDDERVLVAVATVMFTMRVTGPHLTTACKLIFKIARNDKNDHFFQDSNLLELLVEGWGRADPVAEGECCVYAAGALRFLALAPRLRARAHRAGALHLAALHLKILNNAKADRPRQESEQATQALYQVTGALRNLAGGAGGGAGGGVEEAVECAESARAFVASGALAELVTALALHTDRDVLTNVARCLSVVSCEAACCAWLCASAAAARALLQALAACGARAPLAVRLAYTLGNMAAADHRARLHIYQEEDGMDVLLTILEAYAARAPTPPGAPAADTERRLVGSDLGGSDGSNADVIIKTARVVANLCLSAAAGRALARRHAARAAPALLACLRLAARRAKSDSAENEQQDWMDVREELATAVLATLNNVSFYLEEPSEHLDELLDSLCEETCAWVRAGAGAAACEAVRALGNLTRSARAAHRAVLEGALDALPPFHTHEDESVRCAAAGVLVNVCGAGGAAGAGACAARALRAAAAARDAQCGALLARALWNAHAHSPLPPHDARVAAAALATLIDDESVFEACAAAGGAHHVKFDLDEDASPTEAAHEAPEWEDAAEGEDLGFEEGAEQCACAPCRRLAAWERLVAVGAPLLPRLQPPRADASVGTDAA